MGNISGSVEDNSATVMHGGDVDMNDTTILRAISMRTMRTMTWWKSIIRSSRISEAHRSVCARTNPN
jgi:hypothetical protein